MRPFRSRLLAALVVAILSLGLFGTVAFADDDPTQAPTIDPAFGITNLGTTMAFPEDPWGLPTLGFPEDPWPDL
jgi:hypothetical protein